MRDVNNLEIPWISASASSMDSAEHLIFANDDFHLPEFIKEEILMRNTHTQRVIKANVLRLSRLFIVILCACIIVSGFFFVYMIFQSKNFANFSAIVLAYVLLGLSICSLIYIYICPILAWVWSGKAKWFGVKKHEWEAIVVVTVFSFILMDISGVLFYHENMYLSVFRYFHGFHLT